jgi:hypothetical protein
MMKLSDATKKYIFTTKIELDSEGNYVTLREPTMQQFSQLSDDEKDNKKNLKALSDMLPSCVVDSSFTDEDGETPATGELIAKMLKDSSSLEAEVLNIWAGSIPFGSRLKKGKK